LKVAQTFRPRVRKHAEQAGTSELVFVRHLAPRHPHNGVCRFSSNKLASWNYPWKQQRPAASAWS
jgi:hypothetical protein